MAENWYDFTRISFRGGMKVCFIVSQIILHLASKSLTICSDTYSCCRNQEQLNPSMEILQERCCIFFQILDWIQ